MLSRERALFELVCHYNVTQEDAKPACSGFHDTTVIPPIGTHVAIKGTFVTEKNHGKWNEIHPEAYALHRLRSSAMP